MNVFRDPKSGDALARSWLVSLPGLLVACAAPTATDQRVQAVATAPVVIHALAGQSDGSHPRANLIDVAGRLYGTTWEFGPNGFSDGIHSCGSNFYAGTSVEQDQCPGTVFAVNEDGSDFAVVHAFTQLDATTHRNADGVQPVSPVSRGSDGWIYGTARAGGMTSGSILGCGAAYKFDPTDPGATFTTLHSYCTRARFADGQSPSSGLTQGLDGNWYSVASGGTNSAGVITRWTGAHWQNLHSFDAGDRTQTPPTNHDGGAPYGAPVVGSDGKLYGFTIYGGANGRGTIYSLDPATCQATSDPDVESSCAFQVLYNFAPYNFGATDNAPLQSLYLASDGQLYGADEYGGSNGTGIIFQITNAGVFTQLHDFGIHSISTVPRFANSDGSLPLGTPVEGQDGYLYGTTNSGGASGAGTIWRIHKDGSGFESLYSFSTAAGEPNFPYAGLTVGSDGTLYGTTFAGGNGFGTVYSVCHGGSC